MACAWRNIKLAAHEINGLSADKLPEDDAAF